MEDRERKTIQYLVPANVTARFEFFEGFGWYELKVVFIACLIGAIIFFSLGLIKKTVYVDVNNTKIDMSTDINIKQLETNSEEIIAQKVSLIPSIWRAFAIIIPGAGTFFLVKREPSTGRSLMDTWKGFKEFKKKQNLYLYKYNSGSER